MKNNNLPSPEFENEFLQTWLCRIRSNTQYLYSQPHIEPPSGGHV
ncbi:hypothetical protein V6Z11_A08G086300 [Gossypium hirsutum]